MIDVNQITTTLRGLPDQALQKYAMMHKGDPYILSLAVSESNQRKQLRAAGQGQAGAMPQPKVADAAIAGMAQQQLPENQGIAQIPTPNMQNMADGGIAGYDEDVGMADGGMFNFAQAGGPVMSMSGGGHIPRYQGNTTDGSIVGGIPGFQAVQPRAQFTQQGAPENTPFFQRVMESLSGDNKERQLAMIEQKITQGTATPEEIAAYRNEKVKAGDAAAINAKYPQADAIRAKDFPGVKPGFEKPPADMPGATVADKSATKKVLDKLGTTGGPRASGDYPTTAEGYRKRLDVLAGTAAEAKDPFAAMQADITAEEKAASLERKAEFEKGVTARGEAFKGKEGRLAERETRLGKEDERNTGLALLEAGLGMMTSRGPGLSGIAEGAKSGVASYAAGKQRMMAAKDRLDDARDQIEEYRRNEANMTDKERRAMNDDINKTVIQGKKDALAGVKQAYGVNKTEALKLLEVSAADKREADSNASRERAAGAGSPLALYKTLGGGDAEKGFRLATEIQAGKKTMTQAYEAYVTAMAGKDTTITPALTPQQFVAQMKTIQALEKGVPGAIEGKPDRQ